MNDFEKEELRETMRGHWPKVTDTQLATVITACSRRDIDVMARLIDKVAQEHEFGTFPTAKIARAIKRLPAAKKSRIPVYALDHETGKHCSCYHDAEHSEHARNQHRLWMKRVNLDPDTYTMYVGEENFAVWHEEMTRLSHARSVELALKVKMDKRDRSAMHISNVQGQAAIFKKKQREPLTEEEIAELAEAEQTAEELF